MAARTGLKESLQEISALMGLLRSDLIELAETPLRSGGSATVVSHMHWIADRFDELGPALSTGHAPRTPRPARSARGRPAPSRARPAGKTKPARIHPEGPAAARPTRSAPQEDAPPAKGAEGSEPDILRTGPTAAIGRDES
ncbi:hypothetical protein [Kaistia adipata]|uniref:hypothetical protein n=1 Tax=Kaistia adipata TaxID=166954 RepID=UPI0012EC3596|nr:hypothetical protein [Kaistia adipata]